MPILIGLITGTLACGAGKSTLASSSTPASVEPGSTPASNPAATPTATPAPNPTLPPVTTAAAVGLPTPPANAKVFARLEEASGWVSCNSPSCAGGSGKGAHSMAQNQSTPSLDGRSMMVQHSGVWGNALWWKQVGANNQASNFLWDFYVQLDNASLKSAQSLEFDAFQFIGGYNYMIGSQCNYGAGVWDTWDEMKGRWEHTPVPCPKFTPGVWHHIQWYMQRVPNSHNYSYVTLVVDGKSYPVHRSYSAKNLGWGDGAGVQYQLDVNATGGTYQEWIDKSTLTMW